jgi:hypothetical protein
MFVLVLMLLFMAAVPIFVIGVPLLVVGVWFVSELVVKAAGLFLNIYEWVLGVLAVLIAELIGAIEIRPYKG